MKATFVSDNITAQFGYSVQECLENPEFWSENVHPDDRERIFAEQDKIVSRGHHVQEYRFRKKDGRYLWIHDEIKLVKDDAGKPLEIVGSWLDISDRRQAESAWKKSEVLFKAFFESNPIPTIISTPEGVIESVNKAFMDNSGYALEEVEGSMSQNIFWTRPDERAQMIAAIKEHGYINNLESAFYDKSRNQRICLLSSRAVEIDGTQKLLSTLVDVTEQRKAEDSLQKSEQLFKAFFQGNPIPTIISATDGTVLMVNPAFTINPGFTPEEVVGKNVNELGFWRIPEDRERMVAAIKEHGYVDNLESKFYGKGNRPMTCLISSRAIEFEGELRILSIVIDVTEQRKAEKTLKQLEKAKSDFISTVAHELRTPLIAIIGYCELLENFEQMPLNESQKQEYLGIIQSNAEVLNGLVDDLLDIGRIQIGRSLGISRKENKLVELIDKVVASARLKSGRHEIVVERGLGVPQLVWLDAGRITQVLHNLLSNAIKYSPSGGVIKVRVEGQKDRVSIAVADPGIGMTAEQVAQVFNRFYRADKESSESLGLGLGMSIVKQIIKDHGGDIVVKSEPGKGTTVTFSLPVRA